MPYTDPEQIFGRPRSEIPSANIRISAFESELAEILALTPRERALYILLGIRATEREAHQRQMEAVANS